MAKERQRARVSSGVPGLDEVLYGGLWEGSVNIVQGQPGAGKTVLANQFAFALARRGRRSVYITLLSESHEQLLMNLESMAFFDAAEVSRSIFYLSAFAAVDSGGYQGLLRLVTGERDRREASLVIIDGLFALQREGGGGDDFRRMINELGIMAAMTRSLVLLLTNSQRGSEHPEYTMVDGWLELGREQRDYRIFHYLQVHKSRGSNAVPGRHRAMISEDGVQVFPRLESLPPRAWTPTGGRLSTGVTELDAMWGGGIAAATTTVVAGPTGAGKTSLGLQFIGASSEQQPGLIFGFYEQQAELVARAGALGIDLQALLDSGVVRVVRCPPLEASLDELAYKLLAAVPVSPISAVDAGAGTAGVSSRERPPAARLLVDGMEAFRQSALYPDRLGRFLTALADALKSAGTTTLFTLEVEQTAELAARMAPVSAVADNIVVLRQFERDGDIRRTLAIRKARQGPVDHRVRELGFGPNGIVLGKPGRDD